MHTGAPECAHRAPRRHGERMNICQHDTKAPAPREGVGALTPDHQREGRRIPTSSVSQDGCTVVININTQSEVWAGDGRR